MIPPNQKTITSFTKTISSNQQPTKNWKHSKTFPTHTKEGRTEKQNEKNVWTKNEKETKKRKQKDSQKRVSPQNRVPRRLSLSQQKFRGFDSGKAQLFLLFYSIWQEQVLSQYFLLIRLLLLDQEWRNHFLSPLLTRKVFFLRRIQWNVWEKAFLVWNKSSFHFYFLAIFAADLVILPGEPFLITSLMTPTPIICLESRITKRPKGGKSANFRHRKVWWVLNRQQQNLQFWWFLAYLLLFDQYDDRSSLWVQQTCKEYERCDNQW